MVFLYRAPKSFTAEDVIEISTHGGNFIASEVIKLLIKHGARLAENGEFTKELILMAVLTLLKLKVLWILLMLKLMNNYP